MLSEADNKSKNLALLELILDHTKNQRQTPNLIDNSELMQTRKFGVNDLNVVNTVTKDLLINTIKKLQAEKGMKYDRAGTKGYQLTAAQAREVLKDFNVSKMSEIRKDTGSAPLIMLVHDAKGGIGKTATSCGLAVEGALDIVREPRVLLIDADPQGSLRHLLAPHVSRTNNVTVSKLIKSVTKDKDKYDREYILSRETQDKLRAGMKNSHLVTNTIVPNLDMLVVSEDDKKLNIELTKLMGKYGYDSLAAYSDVILKPLYNDYDLIIIDANPSIDMTLYSLYYAANQLLIPTTGHQADVNAFLDYLEVSADIITQIQPADAKGFDCINTIVTRYDETNENIKFRANKINTSPGSVGKMYHKSKFFEDASENNLPPQLYCSPTSSNKASSSVNQNLKEIYLSTVDKGFELMAVKAEVN